MVHITDKKILIDDLLAEVGTAASGALNIFVGTTRNRSGERSVLWLEYEAYVPMALKKMEEIEVEARSRWPVQNITVVHRVGKVDIGEASVVIAVSSAHRDESFKACRFIIDQLKENVPIWKKEHYADGSSEWSMHQHEQPVQA